MFFKKKQSFNSLFCFQQAYTFSYAPYILHEHLTVTTFLTFFFKRLPLLLHSFSFLKTANNIIYLILKYTFLLKKSIVSNSFFKFSTLEHSFFYSFSKLVPTATINISFFNIIKKFSLLNIEYFRKNFLFFPLIEMSSYLKMLLTIKGSAFFLGEILSTKLNTMRSRVERKSYNKFFIFIHFLLSYLLKHNVIQMKGLKIQLKGKSNGAPRAKRFLFSEGTLCVQPKTSKIDYFCSTSYTVYGTFGVKVWIMYA